MNLKPQTYAVLELLRTKGAAGLTPLEALAAVGTLRLGARVWELRDAGWRVESELVLTASGKRVSRYRLIEQPEQLRIAI